MIIGFDGSRSFIKGRTGTENYSYQLLKNLAKIDTENSYLVYIRPGCVVDNSEWPENFYFKMINWPRLWTQGGLALRTFIDPLDVLFVPSHTLPLVRNPFLKTAMTVHDLGAEYLPKMHQLKQRLYLGFITKIQLKGATKLIAVSQATKDDLIKKVGIDPKKVEVIYEAVDNEFFKPVKGDALVNSLKQFGLVSGRYFLFVGTIQPRKNLERLIRAFAHVTARSKATKQSHNEEIATGSLNPRNDEVELVLAGSKGWLSDDIYSLPKELGIENQVKFLGRVEDRYLPALYSGAVGLVFPSLFEGFGLPILEAWSCHSPVLTSNRSSMKEIAKKAAVLVNPLEVGEIREGMKRLINETARKRLIISGSKEVVGFSWEKAARETLAVLKGVVR